jgi:hypothetical protein
MPERVVNFLTGYLPQPVFPIPLETWDDFDMDGTEVMDCEISRMANHWGEVLREIHRRVECKTEFYESYLGWTGTGIVIPAAITGEFGIQMDHYLEVILHNIIKEGKLIPVYPGEMVEHEVRKTLVEPSR